MSDDLENSIHRRMQDFRITPNPQIWERVTAALPPEKRRRRFAIWWWLPIAACLGGGIWMMIDGLKDGSNINNKKIADKKPIHQNKGKQPAVITDRDTTIDYTVQKQVNKKELSADKKQLATKQNVPVNENEIVKSYVTIKPKKHFQKADQKSKNIIETAGTENIVLKRNIQRQSFVSLDIANVLNNSGVNFQLHKAIINNTVLSAEEPFLAMLNPVNIAAPQIVAKTDTTSINKGDTLAKAPEKMQLSKKKIKLNKAGWSLQFAIGRSTLNGGISNEEKALNLSNFNSPVTGSVQGTPTISTGFKSPDAGINFTAGVVRKRIINKQWSWQVALNYGLLTSKQNIGRKNDSLMSNYSYADAYSRSTAFLSASSVYTNQVHRLQIVPRINYTFNPSANSPVQFFAGASFAYHFSNNILLHDYRTGYYIRSASLSNKLLFGSVAGLDVFINKQINAGLYFQHDFTNVGKAKIGSSFHWNSLQLSIGIPLLKHK